MKARHQMLRPTIAAGVLLLIAAVTTVLGLSLDDRTLMAVSLALLALPVFSLLMVLVQWALCSRKLISATETINPRFLVDAKRGTWVQGVLLPHDLRLEEQWIQLDQRSIAVERHMGGLPRKRGLFRLESLMVSWKDPFALWKVRKGMGIQGDEVLLLPDVPQESSVSDKAPDALLAGQSQGFSGVRQYEAGDSPRLIAWKYTAHRGELMTREMDRDKTAELLLLLDPGDSDLESCVQELMRRFESLESGHNGISYSDGTGIYNDHLSIMRQLAAVRTTDDPWSQLPHMVEGFQGSKRTPTTILVVSSRSDEAIAAVMASAPHPIPYRVLHPAGAQETGLRSRAAGPDGGMPSDAAPSPRPVPAGRPRKSDHPSRQRGMAAVLVTVAALWMLISLSLLAMSQLLKPQDAWWPWFIGIGFAVLAVDVGLSMRKTSQSLARALLSSVCMAIVAVLLVVFRIHGSTGEWLFIPYAHESTMTSGGVAEEWVTNTTTLWDVLVDGFDHLYAQYPPVQLSAQADALIIVAAAAVMALIRIMLAQLRLSPVVALLPGLMMVMSYQMTGEIQGAWPIAALVMAFVILLWSTSSGHTGAVAPAVVSAIVTLVSLALLAPAMTVARAVNIPLAPTAGLFSSGTINPMVDLKRGLQEGSDSTVLTYTAPEAMYLRLSTLNTFNGDTWSFSSPSTSRSDGGFESAGGRIYTSVGDGYLLRDADGSDTVWVTPLIKYLLAGRQDSASTPFSTSTGSVNHYLIDSAITIKTLDTQYLPIPGEAVEYSAAIRNGDWHRNVDAVVRSDDDGTQADMRYRVESVYLKPVTNVQGFSSLSDLQSLLDDQKKLFAQSSDALSGRSSSYGMISTLSGDTSDDTGTGKALRRMYGTLPVALPASVRAVIDQGRRQGVSTDGANASEQLAAMRYLVSYFNQKDFVYSLDEPDGNGRDNMEVIGDFLNSKSGYCVHYASALAVLGRGMGLSTRMVLGYIAGQSSGQGSYTVAAKQLHAWVEVYIDGIGWVPFDVTPASSDTQEDTASAASTASSTASESTRSPSPSISSTTLSPSASSSDATDRSEDDETAGTGTSASRQSRAGAIIASVMPAALMVLGIMLLIALAAMPYGLRRRRRIRRYGLLERSIRRTDKRMDTVAESDGAHDDAGEVWLALWSEIVDTSLDVGVRIPSNASDTELAAVLRGLLLGGQGERGDRERLQGLGHGGDGHGGDEHGADGHGGDGHGADGHGADGHGVRSAKLLASLLREATRAAFGAPASSADASGAPSSSRGRQTPLPTVDEVERLRSLLLTRSLDTLPQALRVLRRMRVILLPRSLFRRRPIV